MRVALGWILAIGLIASIGTTAETSQHSGKASHMALCISMATAIFVLCAIIRGCLIWLRLYIKYRDNKLRAQQEFVTDSTELAGQKSFMELAGYNSLGVIMTIFFVVMWAALSVVALQACIRAW
ncbi:hypothetical protein ACFQY8_07115 [Alloscardovia venturai]|uniref:Uncharacterized protein n=1 Tax=Alloscardovia venturai TaxID=1769421 RepID=A0ABW2Y7C7_9BIFI